MQAAGDAGEDLRDIDGAEAAPDSVGFGEGAPSDRGGELPAVFDELADEVEQAPRAARLGDRVRDVGHGGHERNKNMKRGRVARNIFRIAQGIMDWSGACRFRKGRNLCRTGIASFVLGDDVPPLLQSSNFG
jgi:hypothetical protein